MDNRTYERFVQRCHDFSLLNDVLWRRDPKGEHKLVLPEEKHGQIFHDELGHRGFFIT
jgi:hypothetical protein